MTAITSLFFLFLGIAAILLLIATAALHRHSTPSSNSSNGFSLKDLKKLPRFRFSTLTRPETGADQTSCVVCLEEIKQGQWCRNLVACGHVFHRKCVDAWLVKVSACPICRTRVELVHGLLEFECAVWCCILITVMANCQCTEFELAFVLSVL
ncbi:hypothetical protein DKX38_010035 [Salix brachista]|uniref:RING-type domain-containing protein n=1 Tax=Salix brachista TaxID=2182728 RepID=A0A5N5MBZ8_9ROSI|nr:hypothetical protein DKX38_010035 [Salix brachista]